MSEDVEDVPYLSWNSAVEQMADAFEDMTRSDLLMIEAAVQAVLARREDQEVDEDQEDTSWDQPGVLHHAHRNDDGVLVAGRRTE